MSIRIPYVRLFHDKNLRDCGNKEYLHDLLPFCFDFHLQTIGGVSVVSDGFVGCARDYRLGKSENAILPTAYEKKNLITGCNDVNDCGGVDCPRNRLEMFFLLF